MAEVRIEVTCPGCQTTFLRGAEEQGQIVECPNCAGWVDVPEIGRPPTVAEADEAANRRTAQDYDRQLAENARQIERMERLLEWNEQRNARVDQLFNRIEAIVGQWELLAARAVRLIGRLEGH